MASMLQSMRSARKMVRALGRSPSKDKQEKKRGNRVKWHDSASTRFERKTLTPTTARTALTLDVDGVLVGVCAPGTQRSALTQRCRAIEAVGRIILLNCFQIRHINSKKAIKL
jgi:hypothetical protein